ncbi:MAG TPA: helix-turn-helix transcriptional regulator [Sporichthyaceae bacterium]|jgi:transcriptional regulator with XRE-family HTH domain|nr:helix-turn-helix transcriptional regulator [Sporichthyaceae bacterium]
MSASGPEEPEAVRRRWEGVIRVQKPGPANTVRSAAHLEHEADEAVEEVPAVARRAPAWAMAPAEWTVALPRFTAAHSVDCRLLSESASDTEVEMPAPGRSAVPEADLVEPTAVGQQDVEAARALQRVVGPEPAAQQDVEPEPAVQQDVELASARRREADVRDAVAVAVVGVEAVESKVVEVAGRVLAADSGTGATRAAGAVEAVEAEPAEPLARFVRRPAAPPPAVPRAVPVAADSPPQEARVPASRREADPLLTSGGIGARLAEARKSAGLTHEQLARITRIGIGRLVEFENDDYSGCGAGVFARGRLDSIARAVGVDPEPLLQEFDTRHGRGGANSSAEAVHRQLARMSRNWTTVLLVVLALAAVYPVALLVVAVLG